MEKIQFPKSQETLTCEELNIPETPGVLFTFWKNPSRDVITAISDVIMVSAQSLSDLPMHEMRDVEERYYKAVSQLIIDCNIEGLSFDTPEEAMESFNHPGIPMGFVHQVIASYLGHLLQFNEQVKKALALYLVGSDFGKGSARKGAKSMKTSSSVPSKN